MPTGATSRDLIYQAHARGLESIERGPDVLNGDAHVMQSLTSLGDESGDRRVFIGRFQQLDARIADGEQGHADALIGDDLLSSHGESECVLKKLQRFTDRTNRDAQMIDFAHNTRDAISSTIE